MQKKTMTFSTLAKKLNDPKQLMRITAKSLDAYRSTLSYPKGTTWESREKHLATRMVEVGFDRNAVYQAFMSFGTGINVRRQKNRWKYFNDIYAEAVANSKFAKNLRVVIVKRIYYPIR